MNEKAFVVAMLNGGPWVGVVDSVSLENWMSQTGAKCLRLEHPLQLAMVPDRASQSVQMHFAPGSLIGTFQPELYIMPFAVEVVGRINNDEYTGSNTVFYNNYKRAYDAVRAEAHNITIPNSDQVQAALRGDGKQNIRPFNPRR